MLIVALVVLALLAIIATTFAALMRLERKATQNFANTVRADLVAASAESALIASFRGGLNWNAFTDSRIERSPWLYLDDDGKFAYGGLRELDTADPSDTSLGLTIGSLGTVDSAMGFFKTKVIDTAAQININGQQDSLADMLDNLGRALKSDGRYNVNPFFAEPDEGGRQIKGADIIRFRNTLEGNRFESKAQLVEILGQQNYALVADFLTAHSWVDQSTYRSADAVVRYNTLDPNQANTGVGGDGISLRTDVVGASRLVYEPRAPININTAPEPVLVAVLAGLAGRRAFPLVQVDRGPILGKERSEIDLTDNGSLAPGDEENTLRQTPVWVYTEPLSLEVAQRLAREIIAQRKRAPFREWSSGQPGPAATGFEEFVNRLDDGIFPNQTSITVVNPQDIRGSNAAKNSLLRGTGLYQASHMQFSQGHPSNESSTRNSRGLANSRQWAWYYDLVRGVLLANFNPNTRLNKFNPNSSAYCAVDKFGLVKLSGEGANAAQGQPIAGHTTEFCFDSNGIYEVSTVADIATENSENAFVPGERIARAKRRSIVKVFEVLRHTTQADFERPFRAGSFNSANDRKYVTTYPDPMDALHDDLFYGSEVDGRVEISGYTDALRQELDPTKRGDFFNGRGEIQSYTGFRFRDDRSRSNLAKISRGEGSRRGTEFLSEMNKVLDLEFSRSGSQLMKRYSTYYWGLEDAADEGARVREMLVGTVLNGSDLFPDGVNSSLYRYSSRAQGFLRMPASVYRDVPSNPGPLNRNYTNTTGNLPYYQGGVSFWVKLENDGNDPVFNGLFSATQVQTKTGVQLTDSEGTQFYVWRSTSGQLRITRLYYHRAFQQGSTALPIPEFPEEGEDSGGLDPDEQYVDPKKVWARTDVVVDISNWRAREWHHLAIGYDDELPGNRVKVEVDFQDVGAISHNLGQEQFVTLNEEEPKDGMYVAGFFRDQALDDEGLFKFGTNTSADGAPERSDLKRVHANATIDEFVTFSGVHAAPFGPVGYFTDKPAEYTNAFEVPFPDGIERLRLRSISWTLYTPALYNGNPVRFSDQNVAFSVANVGTTGYALQPVRDPGGDSRINQNFAGKWLYSRSSAQSGRTGQLVYQIVMRGALGTGEFGARVVGTPALEDVTLTYFLPSAQTLLTEIEN
ncbi:MAG: hypothetical protein AB7I09_04520 [Planctomycetota bacterium]